MKKITYIYYLHRGDNIPFYVGKTINKGLRKAEHRWKNKGNCKPEFVIVDEIPTEEWIFWEKYWVSQIKTWGFELENKTQGGGGVAFKTPESRKKQSQSLMGHIISDKTKEKMRQSALGRHHTPQQSQRLSQSLKEYYSKNDGSFKGKKHTEETKNKIRKPMEVYDLEGNLVGEYNSLKEAAKSHNTDAGNVIKNMKRCGKFKGLIWRYKK
ncbi:NUMOD1 domain-containing DNA-binding protein [bacterium]|jgi:hypothetical protein|nr:NUMOD1 domain-containing DNA-binding protein [bacterium]